MDEAIETIKINPSIREQKVGDFKAFKFINSLAIVALLTDSDFDLGCVCNLVAKVNISCGYLPKLDRNTSFGKKTIHP